MKSEITGSINLNNLLSLTIAYSASNIIRYQLSYSFTRNKNKFLDEVKSCISKRLIDNTE
jgi:hypothetical protein